MEQFYEKKEKISLLMDRPVKIPVNFNTILKLCFGALPAILFVFALVSCNAHTQSSTGIETVSALPTYSGSLNNMNIKTGTSTKR